MPTLPLANTWSSLHLVSHTDADDAVHLISDYVRKRSAEQWKTPACPQWIRKEPACPLVVLCHTRVYISLHVCSLCRLVEVCMSLCQSTHRVKLAHLSRLTYQLLGQSILAHNDFTFLVVKFPQILSLFWNFIFINIDFQHKIHDR